MSIFAFNSRVYLRRDPSQFGRIGVGMFGGNLDSTGTCQFVFWEHEGADIVTQEPIVDLMSEAEYHERRRLFFSAMRRPEMRLLRAALLDLKHERCVDWRAITELEIWPNEHEYDPWLMQTEQYQQVCLWPNETPLHFAFLRINDGVYAEA